MKWFKNLFGNNKDEYKEEVDIQVDWDTFIPSQKNKKQLETTTSTRGFKFPIISDEEFQKRTFIGSVSIYEDELTDNNPLSNEEERKTITRSTKNFSTNNAPLVNKRRERRMMEEQSSNPINRVARRSLRRKVELETTSIEPNLVKEPRNLRHTKPVQETTIQPPKPKAPFKLTEVPSPVFGFKERNAESVNPNNIVEKIAKQESESTEVFNYLFNPKEPVLTQASSNATSEAINHNDSRLEENETNYQPSTVVDEVMTQKNPSEFSGPNLNEELKEENSLLNSEWDENSNVIHKEDLTNREVELPVIEIVIANSEEEVSLEEETDVQELEEPSEEETVTSNKPVFEYCEDCDDEEVEVIELEESSEEVTATDKEVAVMENVDLEVEVTKIDEETEQEEQLEEVTLSDETETQEPIEEEQTSSVKPVFEYCEDCDDEEVEVIELEEPMEEVSAADKEVAVMESVATEVEVTVVDEVIEQEEQLEEVTLIDETEVQVIEESIEEEQTSSVKPVFEYCEDCDDEEVEVIELEESSEEVTATDKEVAVMESVDPEFEVTRIHEEIEVEVTVVDANTEQEDNIQQQLEQQLMEASNEVAATMVDESETVEVKVDEPIITAPRRKVRPFNVMMTKYDKDHWEKQQEREKLALLANQEVNQVEETISLETLEEMNNEVALSNEDLTTLPLEMDINAEEESISKPKAKIRPFNVLMTKFDKERWEEQQKRERLAAITNETITQTTNEELSSPIALNTIVQEDEGTNQELAIEEELPYYAYPSTDLLNEPVVYEENEQWLNEREEMLNATFASFNIGARVVHRTQGPSVTRFEVQLDPGVKVNKITNLSDDIQLGLAARDIRIEAPIPGKHTVGIEVPNDSSRPVRISEIINTPEFKNSTSPLTSVLGLDIEGKPIVTDLKKMPHGLIAGATGSGKSVCINSILVSLLYKADPTDVKLILIDPKMVELAPYNHIPHLVSPVITDVKAATAALKWAVEEMERRYQLFAHTGVREIGRYNDLVMESKKYNQKLPYIVVVIDELADLMMVAASDVEDSICRIAQKARACGIHLIIATQRPSVDVITGLIKANVPTRIAFSVSSQVDSRTIIDISGAEKLLGKGDMLFLENGSNKAVRLQGTYVTDEEIEAVVTHCKNERPVEYLFQQEDLLKKLEVVEEEDELFLEACEFIIEHNAASASLLQRRFKIGYNRAARLIDMMESYGYISENRGSKPREVLISLSDLKN